MTDSNSAEIVAKDTWVEHLQGRMFVRTWEREPASAQAPVQAPIVLFHDSLGCVDLWREFPALLATATGRRVIAYDRLGFGKSDPRVGVPSLDFIAQEAQTAFPVLRRQLALDRFVAFGHSVGGGMAVHCAAQFAADCEALITESAQMFLEELTARSILEAKQQFSDPQQVERLKKYHGDKARWVIDAWTDTWLDPGFASWSLAGTLPQVRCPVLAMHGIFDEYGSTAHPDMIGTLAGGTVQVEIMPDTHHVPHRERPETVIALVKKFLSSVKQ